MKKKKGVLSITIKQSSILCFLFADVKKKKKRKMRKKLDARQIVPIYDINVDKIVTRIRLRRSLLEPKIYLSHLESLLRSYPSISDDFYDNNSNMSLSYDSCFSPINISTTNHIIHPHLCQQDVSNITKTLFISETRQQPPGRVHCDNNKALIQSESKNHNVVVSTVLKSSSQNRSCTQLQPIIIDKNESNNDQTMIRDVIDDEKIDNINKNASSLSMLSLSSHPSSSCDNCHNHILATPSSHLSSFVSGKPICVNNDDNNNNDLSINNNESSCSERQNLETHQANNRRSKGRTHKKKNRNKRRKN